MQNLDKLDASLFEEIRKKDLKNVQLLIQEGANVNACDSLGNTPLFEACALDDALMVSFLIEHGADVNHQNALGETALHKTIEQNAKKAFMEVLHSRLVDLDVQNNQGETPLMYSLKLATQKMHHSLYHRKNKVKSLCDSFQLDLEFLTQYGYFFYFSHLLVQCADVNKPNRYGNTPLMLASAGGLVKVTDVLLHYNAQVNAQNDNGYSALILASYFGQLDCVKRLIQNGADVSLSTTKGDMALHAALTSEEIEISKLLIAHGSNVTIQNAQQHSALDLIKGNEVLSCALLNNGSVVSTQRVSPLPKKLAFRSVLEIE